MKDKTDLQLESLKMVKEWSTWLVGIQVAVCGFLWNVLKENPMLSDSPAPAFPFTTGLIIHLGWLSFVASLLIAAFTLIRIPKLVESLKQNEEGTGSVLALPIKIFDKEVALKKLAGLQYIFFLAGALLAAVFVVIK